MNTHSSTQPVILPAVSTVQAVRYRKSLRHFAEAAWRIVEPNTPFIAGWHIDAICSHLEAVSRGEIKKLVINMPPRHMKSLLVSVFWPCWEWLSAPSIKWLFASHNAKLATRDSTQCRAIVESDWYKSMVDWRLANDQNQKTTFQNTSKGVRNCTSVGAGATGEGGDRLVVDDPHDAKKANASDQIREAAIEWWRQTFSTRGNNPKTLGKVIVMQRLHERDLAGYLLNEEQGWELLKLPAEYENNDAKRKTLIGWQDPRSHEGELLWPERFDAHAIQELRTSLGNFAAAGQLQQRPLPADGAIFRREHILHWDTLPKTTEMHIIHSWDMSFKDTDGTDYVVGQVWGRVGASFYLIDQVRGQFDFVATVHQLLNLLERHPARGIYVEDKANGPAVLSALRHKVAGLIAVQPMGSKQSRANAVTPLFEAGNVFFPPVSTPWVADLVDELLRFPRAAHDDQVDALTQALNKLSVGISSQLDSLETLSFDAVQTSAWSDDGSMGSGWGSVGAWADSDGRGDGNHF